MAIQMMMWLYNALNVLQLHLIFHTPLFADKTV